MNDALAHPTSVVGRIDLHSHLLPGIDDGCQTLAESLACIRRLLGAGFIGSVCTPHLGPSFYQQTTPDCLAEQMEALRAAIAAAGLEYEVWDGGEVRIAPETIEWFSYWGLPTLASSRCVLLDYWGRQWPQMCEDTCRFLLENGYQPIVAHPERLGVNDEVFEAAVAALREMGAWLQGNLNSISGGEGPLARQRAEKLLHADAYFVLATDTHHPDGMSSRLAALDMVVQEFGAEHLKLLLEDRTREVLAHGVLSANL